MEIVFVAEGALFGGVFAILHHSDRGFGTVSYEAKGVGERLGVECEDGVVFATKCAEEADGVEGDVEGAERELLLEEEIGIIPGA